MKACLFTIGVLFLGLQSFGQQVLGDFTGLDQSEWLKVYWYRPPGNNWDEGLIKNSSTQVSPFKRVGFGIHMHESREFTFWSTGWNPLFAVHGGSGNACLKGSIGIGAPNAAVKFQVNSDNNGTGTVNWIADNMGMGGISGDRIVMGILNGIATIGSHNNALNAWSNLAINPESYGNVSIGTSDAKGYRLAVNGSVIATAIMVMVNANWPDYVFKPNYHLPFLNEVKSYIDKNGHLSNMPSASKLDTQGVNLGKMNKSLVKKVEELTLYLIEMKKEVGQLKKRNKALTAKLS